MSWSPDGYVEENFWDDRTTPMAYSRSDSERDLGALRTRQGRCSTCGHGMSWHVQHSVDGGTPHRGFCSFDRCDCQHYNEVHFTEGEGDDG